MNYFLEIPIRSEICLTPVQCYPVQTFLPGWLTLGLIGLTLLTIYNTSRK